MRCPFCGHEDTQVKDSRPSEDHSSIRRRRTCSECGARFTTFERVQLRDLVVVKKDGAIQSFDRDKLYRSLAIALRKRPIGPKQIDLMVTSIVRQLETLGESDVPTVVIGQKIMDALLHVDQVAYVRYASVYKNFEKVSDFNSFVETFNKLLVVK